MKLVPPALLAFGLVSAGALGCGDKVLVVARNVKYERAFAAKNPASLLLFSEPSSDLASIRRDLEGALRSAGHRVRVAETKADLSGLLAAGGYDFVLVEASRAAEVGSLVETAGSRAEVLPVIAGNTSSKGGSAEARSKCVLKTGGRDKGFLKVLDEAMADHVKGRKAGCSSI